MPWRARPRSSVRARSGLAAQVDLVHDRPGDGHAGPLEERLVEDDLVDRTADAALGHDHRRRAEHGRDLRVRQPDDGPDARVAGAFDQEHVAIGGERAWAALDPAGRSSTTLPSM